MRYPAFVAATVTLTVSLASVLTAWLIVATRRGKPRVQLPLTLTGGLHARTPVIFLGTRAQGMSLPLPPTTQFLPVSTAKDAARVKWLTFLPSVTEYACIVQPGVDPVVLSLLLSRLDEHRGKDIVYVPAATTDLFTQIHRRRKQRRMKKWSAFLRENVHPAWWYSLLFPDTRILLRRAALMRMTPECARKCTTMVKFMRRFNLWNDQFMFGYFFSPLSGVAVHTWL